MEWWQISNVLIPLAGMATGVITMYGLYRLANKLIDRKSGGRLDSDALDRIAKLEQEIEDMRGEHTAQLEEMHERLDFAERILANPEKR